MSSNLIYCFRRYSDVSMVVPPSNQLPFHFHPEIHPTECLPSRAFQADVPKWAKVSQKLLAHV
jgi:hypothetical protein